MPILIVTDATGTTTEVSASKGFSLMEALRDEGFEDIQAMCGGCSSCATCHVIVDPAFDDRLPPISDDEEDLLDSLPERAPTSRLSCQVPIVDALDGMGVTVPAAI